MNKFVIAVYCGKPGTPVNGGYRYYRGTYYFKDTITYFCNEGYFIEGPTVTTCKENARWSVMPPTCKGNKVFQEISWKRTPIVLAEILCNDPPLPPHSTYKYTSFRYRGVVTYECDYQYCWNRDMSIRCGSRGTWEGTVPQCKRTCT